MATDLLASLRVEILEWDFTHCGPWWHFRGVNSPFTRVYFVTSGSACVVQQNRRYELTPGTLSAVPAHTTADFRCDSSMDLYWIHIDAQVAGGVEFFSVFKPPLQVTPPASAAVENLCRRFVRSGVQEGLSGQLEREGIMRVLLAQFCAGLGPLAPGPSATQFERFGDVLRHIEENIADRLSAADLAALMHLNPVYFSNLFSRHFGMGPAAFVLKRRIERARGRLWHSRDKLSAIAAELGFCDEFHLSKAFKQATGMSPRQFRAQERF